MINDFKNSRPVKTSFIGVVTRTAFVASDSFYQVLVVKVIRASFAKVGAEITVVGRFGEILVGQAYEFKGRWQKTPRYGFQFQVSDYRKIEEDLNG